MKKNLSTKNVPDVYVKSPFDLIKAPVDWGTIGSKILTVVVASLQDRFKRYYEGDENGQLSLFSESEFDEHDEVTINISLPELRINPKHYDQIESTCERLSKIIVPVIEKDSNGNISQMYRQMFTVGFNIDINNQQKFALELQRKQCGDDSVKTPWKTGKKKKNIIVKISRSVTENYFRGGNFALHLMNIAHNCSCGYTTHLYMYLSKFREYKKETTISYEELRKMMGMYKFDENGNKQDDEGKYPRFKDFVKRVLEPARAEMDALYSTGDIDLTFEYDAIYKNDVKRGNPLKIHFAVRSEGAAERKVIVDNMSMKERVAYANTGNVDEAKWSQLATAMEDNDRKWWNTFGVCCSTEGVIDGVLTIKVPSMFVIEQWNERIDIIRKNVEEIWGVSKIQYDNR